MRTNMKSNYLKIIEVDSPKVFVNGGVVFCNTDRSIKSIVDAAWLAGKHEADTIFLYNDLSNDQTRYGFHNNVMLSFRDNAGTDTSIELEVSSLRQDLASAQDQYAIRKFTLTISTIQGQGVMDIVAPSFDKDDRKYPPTVTMSHGHEEYNNLCVTSFTRYYDGSSVLVLKDNIPVRRSGFMI
jgi:hypothetical protein